MTKEEFEKWDEYEDKLYTKTKTALILQRASRLKSTGQTKRFQSAERTVIFEGSSLSKIEKSYTSCASQACIAGVRFMV